jgi:hypothetical protein
MQGKKVYRDGRVDMQVVYIQLLSPKRRMIDFVLGIKFDADGSFFWHSLVALDFSIHSAGHPGIVMLLSPFQQILFSAVYLRPVIHISYTL